MTARRRTPVTINRTSRIRNGQGRKMDRPRKTRRSFTLAEKILIIQHYETHNRSCREIAEMFGCSFQTIQNIIRHKDEHLEDWSNNLDPHRVRYRPNSRMRLLQFVTFEWVRRCRYYPMRITDQLIRDTGEEAAYFLGIAEPRKLTGSGWVQRFKDKFKLTNQDLMNTDRVEVLTATNEDKQSLDIESIVEEMKGSYGNIITNNQTLPRPPSQYTVSPKRRKLSEPESQTYSSPSSVSLDTAEDQDIETIDLTESVHSDDSGNEDDDELLVPVNYADYRQY